MKISIAESATEKFPEMKFCFVKADSIVDYSSDRERANAEEAMVYLVNNTFKSVEGAQGHYLNDYYRSFYRDMGLRKGVLTPLVPVTRVLKNQTYRSIHKAIDISLMAEYPTLVSIQVYDAEKIRGDLLYRLATGSEQLVNFHGESKTAKEGELVLVDNEGLVHSSYYGNNAERSLDSNSRLFLFRIMSVPGLREEDFASAIRRVLELAGSSQHVVVSSSDPIGELD
jgi:DNA/RNA-binding domain of Phe-tRNA-synthetase-like protein